ncbi:MAG: hypothetical protein AB1641_04700 [Thermodesulfobacteriota bacterium]
MFKLLYLLLIIGITLFNSLSFAETIDLSPYIHNNPFGLAVDPDNGNFYISQDSAVLHPELDNFYVFSSQGAYLSSSKMPLNYSIYGRINSIVASEDNYLYVNHLRLLQTYPDVLEYTISKVSKDGKNVISSFSLGAGAWTYYNGLTLNTNNHNLFVGYFDNTIRDSMSRIVEVTQDGVQLSSFQARPLAIDMAYSEERDSIFVAYASTLYQYYSNVAFIDEYKQNDNHEYELVASYKFPDYDYINITGFDIGRSDDIFYLLNLRGSINSYSFNDLIPYDPIYIPPPPPPSPVPLPGSILMLFSGLLSSFGYKIFVKRSSLMSSR